MNERKTKKRSKYSPQERDRIRRERNRMHAKRTRDRKKMFLEASEQIINRMEKESLLLREYLVSIEAMTEAEAHRWNDSDRLKKLEIGCFGSHWWFGVLEHDKCGFIRMPAVTTVDGLPPELS